MTPVIRSVAGSLYEGNATEKRRQANVPALVWTDVVEAADGINGLIVERGRTVDRIRATVDTDWDGLYPQAFTHTVQVNGAAHTYRAREMTWTYYKGNTSLIYRWTPR